MTKLKSAALTALLLGALGTALVLQHQSLTRSRDDNHSLRQRLEELGLTNERLANAAGDTNALARWRQNEKELLRLRGEVTLQRRDAKTAAEKAAATGRAPASGTPAAPSSPTHFEGQVHAQVGPGQTLLTGGWSSQPGKRIFLLAVPSVKGDALDQVDLTARFVEVPDTALPDLGLDPLKLEGGSTSLKQQLLAAQDADSLWTALRQTDGVQPLDQPRVTTLDGRPAAISFSQPQVIDGVTQDIGQFLTVTPVISSDKATIDLTLNIGPNPAAPK